MNGQEWARYEKLWLADREENKKEHAEIRADLRMIMSRQDKREGGDKARLVILNLGVPAFVAFAVALLTLFAF